MLEVVVGWRAIAICNLAMALCVDVLWAMMLLLLGITMAGSLLVRVDSCLDAKNTVTVAGLHLVLGNIVEMMQISGRGDWQVEGWEVLAAVMLSAVFVDTEKAMVEIVIVLVAQLVVSNTKNCPGSAHTAGFKR